MGCVSLLVTLGYACSPPGNSQEKAYVPSTIPISKPTVAPEEMQSRKEAMRRTLKGEAKWANLEDLEERSQTPLQSETRIWVGFDGAETPCFILRSDATQKSATYISARFVRSDGKVKA